MMDKEELTAWAKRVVDASRPQLEASETFAIMVTEGLLKDPLCATHLGMAILLDKPIILMVKVGTQLPKHFEKVADGIVYFHDREDLKAASVRFKAILDKIKAEKGLGQ